MSTAAAPYNRHTLQLLLAGWQFAEGSFYKQISWVDHRGTPDIGVVQMVVQHNPLTFTAAFYHFEEKPVARGASHCSRGALIELAKDMESNWYGQAAKLVPAL